MTPEIQAFATGFPITLLHAGVTLLMLVLGVFLYGLLSPFREVPLIREGNAAAAASLGGVMVGLGETDEEILEVMRDLRAHNVDMLTIGQYLQPSGHHLPVLRYVDPSVFRMWEAEAKKMGFMHAAVGAMVRSSYHADQQAHQAGVGHAETPGPA